jgi:hypothetical protein
MATSAADDLREELSTRQVLSALPTQEQDAVSVAQQPMGSDLAGALHGGVHGGAVSGSHAPQVWRGALLGGGAEAHARRGLRHLPCASCGVVYEHGSQAFVPQRTPLPLVPALPLWWPSGVLPSMPPPRFDSHTARLPLPPMGAGAGGASLLHRGAVSQPH